MPEYGSSGASVTPWYRKVAQVIFFPFVLPLVAVVFAIACAICIYAAILNFVSEMLFWARMRQRGRFLRWRQLCRRIAKEGAGTLIIESPSQGWGFTRAWWTPEKVLTVSPYAVPTDDEYRRAIEKGQCLDWDRWHWKNYTDADKGKGFLLRVWNGGSLEKWLIRTFPSVDVVHTWTALVHAPEPGGAP